MSSKTIGNLGERIAESYLKKRGYQILDKNYFFRTPGYSKKGEIDIVAKKSDLISFVEVKTLINNGRGRTPSISPEEKVNFSKQRKLRITAESWLMKKKIPLNSKWQIDVMGIEIKNGKAKISHFENAISYL
jgi:putative endonuclease